MTGETSMRAGGRGRRVRRAAVLLLAAILAGAVVWWAVGRVGAAGRRIVIREEAQAEAVPPRRAEGLRVLAWNIAHGRGDADPGWRQNWRGGSAEERIARLARIALFLRNAEADVVVLNEVDFRASWSADLNQAEILAKIGVYPHWVEQRSFDFRAPVFSYAFGNAILSRFPVQEAEWVGLPVHSRLERMVIGAKAAAVVRLATPAGSLAVVPIHLEFRSEETRLAAVRVLDELRSEEAAPMILAGDFNAAPPGWPGAAERTVLGDLLDRGWRSRRARDPPGPEHWTFPTFGPERALDWILVEPPLEVREVRVLPGAAELSDHAPVLAVVVCSGQEVGARR